KFLVKVYAQDEKSRTGLPNTSLSELAFAVVDELKEFSVEVDQNTLISDIYQFLLAQAATLFIHFRLFSAARDVVSLLLNHQPNNIALLILFAYLNHQIGLHQFANDILEYCECFIPNQPEFQTLLFQSQLASNNFEDAIRTSEKINSHLPSPQWEYELASSALKANLKSISQLLCKQILEKYPDDGIALALYAEASDEINSEKREIKFDQAIQLNPSHPYPWLAYARFLKMINPAKSLEILKAAEQTLPHSPEIQLALGKYYANENQPSLALIHLKNAEELLNTESPQPITFSTVSLFDNTHELPTFTGQIQLRYSKDYNNPAFTFDQIMADVIEYLGRTLRELGHLDEALDL
ncbi:MAG: tetratricopeptide repeat protein, partial [Anaerolineales bacterium]